MLRKIKNAHYALVLSIFLLSVGCESKNQTHSPLTSFVDPFIGTDGHGHTFPGATVPFGMIQLSPDNGKGGWDWVSGYHYSSDSIAGFSHMHLSGTGIGDWLDIAVMPLLEPTSENKADTRTTFSHDNEQAHPGYYNVTLDNGITADLTVSERVGYHKYTFPKNTKEATLRIDLHHAYNWDKPTETELKVLNDSTLIGKRYSQGWANKQHVYFTLRSAKPFQKVLINGKEGIKSILQSEKDTEGAFTGSNAQLVFENTDEVEIKVALSMTNNEKATLALKEIPDWQFEKAKERARKLWEEELNKIQISSKDEAIQKVFYSALYHTAISPTLYSDADGEYKNAKDEVHKMTNSQQRYTLFSLWDTFRALHPLYTLTQPDRYTDILNSMLAFYDENGLLPVWDLSTFETNTMTGYHAVPVLADAVLKDWPGLDAERALEAMLKSAYQDIREVPAYIEYGYVPQDVNGGSVTKTLEYAFDDYCIALTAKKLGKDDVYETFIKRAKNYTHHFDSASGFMRAKYKNGEFVEPFDPFYSEHDFDKSQYIEGNAWQHSFFVPHDVRGLAKLFPEKDGLSKMLDSLFVVPSEMTGENISPDASGFIGQYAHGNEPSHQIAYMYSYLGEAWKTQEKVREILDSMYNETPEGYAGNEDAGQMSAWAVWSMLGIYPVAPIGGEYVFGSPAVDEAYITLPTGGNFHIVAHNNSKENVYIQSVKLNGEEYHKTYITHDQLLKGGKIEFYMGGEANKSYGKEKDSWPSSMEN